MTTPLTSSKPVKFLALGDSYTIGEGVSESELWPVQLSDLLAAKGVSVPKTDIIATTGWTTTELLNGINTANPDSTYALVSLLIGVNNQYRGLDVAIYQREFETLLQQAIGFAGGESSAVFVVSIPNYGVTPFGQSLGEERIRQELLAYNAIAQQISFRYGVTFVDVTPISEQAKTDSTLIAADQLHPSAKMYALWTEEILPVVMPQLQQ